MQKKTHEVDMVSGAIFSKLVMFAIPVMLSGFLQLLFNAADVIVVGRFAGDNALAAVGSTSSLVNLLVNLFLGLSVGTNVLVSHYVGSGQREEVERTVHTAIAMAVISGVILIFVGLFFTRPMLVIMGSPKEVLPLSAIYLKIYFAGMPAMMVYNFGSAILRAVGDTKRPMYYLSAAGVLNVGLNLFFVIGLGISVKGVALATTISQVLSAGLVVWALMREEGMCHLDIKKLRIYPDKLKRLIRIGLPAGMQGMVFSISNVLIQSSINSFGSVAMAGNTASASVEGFVYVSMNSMHQTAISFISQNYGAGKWDRIKRIAKECLAMVTVIGLVMGIGVNVCSGQLLHFFSTKEEVIAYGATRLLYVALPYCMCGWMDTLVGVIRGLGYSLLPTIVSLIGACGFRVVWICTIFQWVHTLPCLYSSYPVSWILTAAAHMTCLFFIARKLHPHGKEQTKMIEIGGNKER
ncbi:putative efflux protein, MATE family [Lachnospiraceae bacterium XBB1006]|nr:putative efflux protein, MATE family [Lachnospiraceae bacterium XBB1006]